jgi:hypothetical protein
MLAIKAAAQLCTICLFGHYTVSSVLSDKTLAPVQRDLDLAELWSGVASTVAAAQVFGLSGLPFDKFRIPGVTNLSGPGTEDITTKTGFLKALALVLRLRPGGLLGMAPTCSSFGFGPSSRSKRGKSNWAGDVGRAFVRIGNLEAQIAMFLFCVAVARDVHVWMENPSGSYMFSFLAPTLRLFQRAGSKRGRSSRPADQQKSPLKNSLLSTGYCERCAYITDEDVDRRENYLKRYKFVASGSWIHRAMKKCPCGKGTRHEPLMTADPLDPRKMTGRKEHMKKSAAYPAALGRALVAAWRSGATFNAALSSQPSAVQPRNRSSTLARVARSHSSSSSTTEDDPWSEGCSAPSEPAPKKHRIGSAAHAAASACDSEAEAWSEAASSESDPWAE